jgi:Chaperone for flagella basal body P-ring formation
LASYQGYSSAETEEQAPGQGFRVWRTMKDTALGRRWFWIEACGVSQRPAQLLWAPLSLEKITPVTETPTNIVDHLLVHRGDAVVVTQASGALSMRLAGHALEQGELGGSIRVQIHTWNNVTVLAAKISGKDEVRLGD